MRSTDEMDGIVLIFVGSLLSAFCFMVYRSFFSQPTRLPPKWPSSFISQIGDWALVTGSSQGLGRNFVEVLAKQGINCILVSRSPSQIENLKASYPNVQFREFVADLSKLDEVNKVIEMVKNLPIGLAIIKQF